MTKITEEQDPHLNGGEQFPDEEQGETHAQDTPYHAQDDGQSAGLLGALCKSLARGPAW